MKHYVLGVDGGNTKTDYYLFDTQGNLIDGIREGTCSHEQLKDSYRGSYRKMKEAIDYLLQKNNLSVKDMTAAAFGLAGVDVPMQRKSLEKVVEELGFTNYAVDNDSFLGIKAGTLTGYGVCSINGTGTVVGGIDPSGARLQIGGIGEISGDDAGGASITKKLLRAVYDSLYRCGTKTELEGPVMKLLGIEDKYYYTEAINNLYQTSFSHTEYVKLVFDYADKGEEVASELIECMSRELAKSTVGCINNLNFKKEVDVVLAGSVWVKPKTDILLRSYKKNMTELTDHNCQYILLEVPPATGAVLWALEIAYGKPVGQVMRELVIKSMEAYQ